MQKSYSYLVLLGKRLLLALLIFSLCRILFYLLNIKYFPHAGAIDFLSGVVFDVCAISMYFIPFILVSLLFFLVPKWKFYHFINNFLFHVSMVLCISMNALDFEFFKFTSKRSTADFFTMMSFGNDASNLIPSMLKKYWIIALIGIGIIVLSFYLYRKTKKAQDNIVSPGIKLGIVYFFISSGLVFMGARMSFGVNPLNLNYASNYASPENIPLVINTPFSMIKTINEQGLPNQIYFEPQELKNYYSSIEEINGIDTLGTKPNIIIFIMESLSNEYIGFLNKKESCTPFLDSLMSESLVFENAFANGKRSIEATPTVTASMPSLMESPYITSSYTNNRLKSIAGYCKDMGYSTSFWHGASNGSMAFDAFAESHDFDKYFGRSEFGDDRFHDGTWGIYDEEFFQFWIKNLNKEKEPFLSTHFTLTAHSPYPLPEKYKNVFKGGKTPMHNSQRYADFALRKFFQVAKKQSWYSNTIFLFVADHSSDSDTEEYQNAHGRYKIPLFIYNAKWIKKGINSKIAQQTDIMPTALYLAGYKGKVHSFGKSLFSDTYNFAVQYVNGVYQMIDSVNVLHFNGKEVIAFYDRIKDSDLQKNIYSKNKDLAEKKANYLKAYLQDYFYRIQYNKLFENE